MKHFFLIFFPDFIDLDLLYLKKNFILYLSSRSLEKFYFKVYIYTHSLYTHKQTKKTEVEVTKTRRFLLIPGNFRVLDHGSNGKKCVKKNIKKNGF